MGKQIQLVDLGVEPYGAIQQLQNDLVDRRQREEIGDVLLLLEHEPVITLGRRADASHVLASRDMLDSLGVSLHESERGGDVTYHGPGQLIAYPILKLPDYELGSSDYMHRLEDVAAAVVSDYGIATHRRPGVIGVWVGDNKIAALGVRIRRRITFHGFALNVAPDMKHWGLIVPCGITDGGVTSLARELGEAPSMGSVKAQTAAYFAGLFGVDLVPATLGTLGVTL